MRRDIGALSELSRLFEADEYMDVSRQGRPLEAAIPAGIDLDQWKLTCEDEFDDIRRTIGANHEKKLWKAPGPYPKIGAGTMGSPQKPRKPVYTQFAPSQLGLIVRKEPKVAMWSSNLSTGVFHPGGYRGQPNISFAQQYFYVEMNARMPDPNAGNGAGATLWPALWAYSIGNLGGKSGDMTRNPIEMDFLELYLQPGHGRTNRQWHGAMHHHEPQKLIAPGAWGRDVHDSHILDLEPNAAVEVSDTFTFWNSFNRFGGLVTPEHVVWYFNRIEICRGPMTPRMHQKFYFLISHQIKEELEGGMPNNVDYAMVVDSFRVWQNPDWHSVEGDVMQRSPRACRGDATIAVFTSGLPMPRYEDGRSFVLAMPSGLKAGGRLAANGLEAKAVFRHATYDTIPPSGSLTPVRAGDVLAGGWHGFRYDPSLDDGQGGWILLNAGWSFEAPPEWKPEQPSVSPLRVDRVTIEAGLAEKHGLAPSLFPAGHPARETRIPSDEPLPRMPPSQRLQISEGLKAGTLIGQFQVANAPRRSVRYTLSGSSHYAIDPGNGQVTVAPGFQTEVGEETLQIAAWPLPPMPMPSGSNFMQLRVVTRQDIPFDPSFLGQAEIGKVALWIEPGDPSTLDLDGERVLGIANKADPRQIYRPARELPELKTVSFGTAAFNGTSPGLLSPNPPAAFVDTSGLGMARHGRAISNIVTRGNGLISINLAGTSILSRPFDTESAHMGAFIWSPAAIAFYVNDEEVGIAESDKPFKAGASGFAFWALQSNGPGARGLGRVYDSSGGLFNNAKGEAPFDGVLGRLIFGTSIAPLSTSVRQKLFGEAAHRFALMDRLPSDNPYRTAPPRMFA